MDTEVDYVDGVGGGGIGGFNDKSPYDLCNETVNWTAGSLFCNNSDVSVNAPVFPDEVTDMERIVSFVVPVLFGIIFIVGLFGNALVVIVVASNQQMRNTTNILIINLAVADLLFIIFCVPFTAADYVLSYWPFGITWCKTVQYLIIVTAYVSVYTLVIMSVDRFLAVVYPVASISIRTEKNTYLAIAIAWAIILISCLPVLSAHGLTYYTSIVVVGCCALMVQFFTAPKYSLNTYAIIPFDNWILRIFFAAHEFCFMWHCWAHAASTVVIGQVFGVTYTHIVDRMGDVLHQLSKCGQIDIPTEHNENRVTNFHENPRSKSLKFCTDRRIYLETIIPGTEYNITGIIGDYKKFMLAAKEFNSSVGPFVGGTTGLLYLQFVSDVFMLIQLLKEPGVDFMSVFFFFEDAIVGMFMMFHMLILMSRLWPKSDAFVQEFRNYMQNRVDNRRYLRRQELTLRRVSAKLWGHNTSPRTVPKGIHVLFNYYIAAAMWERPPDRRT